MTAVFRGGLLAETPATNGITRLMAKVLLKGTTTRTAEQIADTIEAVGGRSGKRCRQQQLQHLPRRDASPICDSGRNCSPTFCSMQRCRKKPSSREKEVQLGGHQGRRRTAHDRRAQHPARERSFGEHPYALRSQRIAGSRHQAYARRICSRFAIVTSWRRTASSPFSATSRPRKCKRLFEQMLAGDEAGRACSDRRFAQPPMLAKRSRSRV